MSDSFVIRELEDSDLPELAKVMAEGFPRHSLGFWQDRLRRIGERERPSGTQEFGYCIEEGGLQGAVLALGSLHGPADNRQVIVNISSWTVRPAYRGPAAKALYRHATSDARVTYSNLSAAANTLKTITSFGFKEGTAGQVLAIGTLQANRPAPRILSSTSAEAAGLSPEKVEMLRYHAAHGCLAFCVEFADRLAPVIFLPRRVKLLIPVAQLIYCEGLSDFLNNSRGLYLELLGRGFPAMLVDASGPIDGLKGRYFPGKAAKYYKGRAPVHAVDHTYSEMIYIGF